MFYETIFKITVPFLHACFIDNSRSTSGSGSGSFELTPPLLSSSSVGEATEQSNCFTDRQSALASQKQNESIIIPECTSNGHYRKVQCAQGKLSNDLYTLLNL